MLAITTENETVRSVERALDIMECFSLGKNELTLAEISEMINLPKATVFRLLATLISRGYVVSNENQRYMLGLKPLALSNAVKSTISVRNIALPFMEQLNSETKETVDLNVLDKFERVCIEKIESEHPLRNIIRIGERNSLIYGASGKVLLSFQDDTYVEQTLNYYQITDETFKSKLWNDIRKIREQKYALTIGERMEGAFAISAPIFDYTGKLEASITIAGPVVRLSGNESLFIEKIKTAGAEISNRLGYVSK